MNAMKTPTKRRSLMLVLALSLCLTSVAHYPQKSWANSLLLVSPTLVQIGTANAQSPNAPTNAPTTETNFVEDFEALKRNHQIYAGSIQENFLVPLELIAHQQWPNRTDSFIRDEARLNIVKTSQDLRAFRNSVEVTADKLQTLIELGSVKNRNSARALHEELKSVEAALADIQTNVISPLNSSNPDSFPEGAFAYSVTQPENNIAIAAIQQNIPELQEKEGIQAKPGRFGLITNEGINNYIQTRNTEIADALTIEIDEIYEPASGSVKEDYLLRNALLTLVSLLGVGVLGMVAYPFFGGKAPRKKNQDKKGAIANPHLAKVRSLERTVSTLKMKNKALEGQLLSKTLNSDSSVNDLRKSYEALESQLQNKIQYLERVVNDLNNKNKALENQLKQQTHTKATKQSASPARPQQSTQPTKRHSAPVPQAPFQVPSSAKPTPPRQRPVQSSPIPKQSVPKQSVSKQPISRQPASKQPVSQQTTHSSASPQPSAKHKNKRSTAVSELDLIGQYNQIPLALKKLSTCVEQTEDSLRQLTRTIEVEASKTGKYWIFESTEVQNHTPNYYLVLRKDIQLNQQNLASVKACFDLENKGLTVRSKLDKVE
ncbi:MAG: hypothetical protein AAFY72_07025 [Cyanobacteria bacterium J06649_4]